MLRALCHIVLDGLNNWNIKRNSKLEIRAYLTSWWIILNPSKPLISQEGHGGPGLRNARNLIAVCENVQVWSNNFSACGGFKWNVLRSLVGENVLLSCHSFQRFQIDVLKAWVGPQRHQYGPGNSWILCRQGKILPILWAKNISDYLS